jgi:excinuclease ABC subunit B
VIFYADKETDSIKRTLAVTAHRREKQLAYNVEHGITPQSVKRTAQASLHVYDGSGRREEDEGVAEASTEDVATVIAELEVEMTEASGRLEFERAALLRDQIAALQSGDFKKLAKTGTGGGGRKRGGWGKSKGAGKAGGRR